MVDGVHLVNGEGMFTARYLCIYVKDINLDILHIV